MVDSGCWRPFRERCYDTVGHSMDVRGQRYGTVQYGIVYMAYRGRSRRIRRLDAGQLPVDLLRGVRTPAIFPSRLLISS